MTIDALTESFRQRVGEDSGLSATIKFDFGEEGVIFVDASSVPNRVSNEDREADCTIRMALEDFNDMIAGELNPTTAFMMGKLKIDGAMSLALKLADLI
jgi:putative sterol carrier protein